MRTKNEPCPKCRERGRDRRGDNLVRYSDSGAHCFSCGHHEHPKGIQPKVKEQNGNAHEEGPLPRDFTREVPAMGWRWLLQYGLPYSYWKEFTGYSPATERLILTHGNPVEVSVGRFVGANPEDQGALQLWSGGVGGLQLRPSQPVPKWRMWGDRLRSATLLEPKERRSDEVILVEDIVSAHKVREAGYTAIPIFGSNIYPKVLSTLRPLKRPVALWLDGDLWGVLPPKLNRLQAFLNVPVRFIRTDKDPKEYDVEQIRATL